MKDYYRVLQVSRYASLQEIKYSYRKLARQYHPDKNFGNPHYQEIFLEIQEAYVTLSDSFKRKWYDERFFSPAPVYTVYVPPRRPPYHYVRQNVPMNKKDKQIFYGGILLFLIAVAVLYYLFAYPLPTDDAQNTGWAIRDSSGNERKLSPHEFDSMLQVYHLRPEDIRWVIDSLKNSRN